jgi:hypothetical protein
LRHCTGSKYAWLLPWCVQPMYEAWPWKASLILSMACKEASRAHQVVHVRCMCRWVQTTIIEDMIECAFEALRACIQIVKGADTLALQINGILMLLNPNESALPTACTLHCVQRMHVAVATDPLSVAVTVYIGMLMCYQLGCCLSAACCLNAWLVGLNDGLAAADDWHAATVCRSATGGC